jgi:hypothetical protein
MKSTYKVAVILTGEELAEVKRRAGLVPLSAWFRSLALSGGNLEVPKVNNLARDMPDAPSRPAPQRELTCPHGKARDYHCGLCGGKAKV